MYLLYILYVNPFFKYNHCNSNLAFHEFDIMIFPIKPSHAETKQFSLPTYKNCCFCKFFSFTVKLALNHKSLMRMKDLLTDNRRSMNQFHDLRLYLRCLLDQFLILLLNVLALLTQHLFPACRKRQKIKLEKTFKPLNSQ